MLILLVRFFSIGVDDDDDDDHDYYLPFSLLYPLSNWHMSHQEDWNGFNRGEKREISGCLQRKLAFGFLKASLKNTTASVSISLVLAHRGTHKQEEDGVYKEKEKERMKQDLYVEIGLRMAMVEWKCNIPTAHYIFKQPCLNQQRKQ